jgi:hypothetical protein
MSEQKCLECLTGKSWVGEVCDGIIGGQYYVMRPLNSFDISKEVVNLGVEGRVARRISRAHKVGLSRA